MSSTPSTEQSDLFAHLRPAFKKASGSDVTVVALGTGQALDMVCRGDADVVFVHVKQTEPQKFVDWVTSPAGQAAIADYKIGGEQLFFPNAVR